MRKAIFYNQVYDFKLFAFPGMIVPTVKPALSYQSQYVTYYIKYNQASQRRAERTVAPSFCSFFVFRMLLLYRMWYNMSRGSRRFSVFFRIFTAFRHQREQRSSRPDDFSACRTDVAFSCADDILFAMDSFARSLGSLIARMACVNAVS